MQKLARQAVKTFTRDPKLSAESFKSNYDKLCGLLDTLTLNELNLNPRLLHDRGHYNVSTTVVKLTTFLPSLSYYIKVEWNTSGYFLEE